MVPTNDNELPDLATKVQEFLEPRTHLVISEFLSSAEERLVWQEIESNMTQFAPGTYQIDWVDAVRPEIKRNVTYTVNGISSAIEDSVIRLLFYNRICFEELMINRFLLTKSPVYQLLRFTSRDTTRVSAYADGDYYHWHTDQSPHGLLTILLMLCREPRAFTGGDFELEWDGATKTIPFQNNTLVIFARNTPHRVSPIVSHSSSFWNRRFSVQFFPDF